MAKYEILRVDMTVDGVREQTETLGDILSKVRQRISDTATSIGKAFGNMNTNVKKGISDIAQLYKALATGKYVKVASGTLSRTISGFDEINRLAKKTGTAAVVKQNEDLVQSVSDLVGKVAQLGSDVKEKVFTPLNQWATEEFSGTLDTVGQKLAALFGKTQEGSFGVNSYADAWDRLNLKTSFWKDLTAETTEATGVFNEALKKSGLAAGSTSTEMEKLNGLVSGTSGRWLGLQSAAQSTWDNISSVWGGSGTWFSQNVTQPVDTAFSGLLTRMEQDADTSWSSTKSVFSDAGGFFSQVFSDAWGDVTGVFSKDGEVFVDIEDGVLSGFKDVVNDLIDGINEVSAVPFSGLNNALNKLQGIQIGNLKPFSFLNWRASVPQIPHLARGAVLPANRPFLAMVGDQRHGTNIEAPLSTIQEAVAVVMQDFISSNMAGHEATVAVLREILEAVLGIRIGDEVIASAYDRYKTKMAVVRGR